MSTDQFNKSVSDSIKNLVKKDLGLQDAESPNDSTETGDVFEYHVERLGRQTTHYIKSKRTMFYFSRRPGQTDNDMRQLGDWIAKTLTNASNKAKLPTSFSDWLASNQDSIDIGGNEIPDRIAANHDIYKNGNPFQ